MKKIVFIKFWPTKHKERELDQKFKIKVKNLRIRFWIESIVYSLVTLKSFISRRTNVVNIIKFGYN